MSEQTNTDELRERLAELLKKKEPTPAQRAAAFAGVVVGFFVVALLLGAGLAVAQLAYRLVLDLVQ